EVGELHRRFSEWLYPLLFGAIAAYVAGNATSGRQSRTLPVVAGVAIALGMRATGFVTISGAGGSTTSAILSYVVPAAGSVLFLVLRLAGWYPTVPKPLASLAQQVAESVVSLFRRKSPAGGAR